MRCSSPCLELIFQSNTAPPRPEFCSGSVGQPASVRRRPAQDALLHSLPQLRQRQTTYPVPVMTTLNRPSPTPIACTGYPIDKRPITARAQRPRQDAKTSHEPRSTSPWPLWFALISSLPALPKKTTHHTHHGFSLPPRFFSSRLSSFNPTLTSFLYAPFHKTVFFFSFPVYRDLVFSLLPTTPFCLVLQHATFGGQNETSTKLTLVASEISGKRAPHALR